MQQVVVLFQTNNFQNLYKNIESQRDPMILTDIFNMMVESSKIQLMPINFISLVVMKSTVLFETKY